MNFLEYRKRTLFLLCVGIILIGLISIFLLKVWQHKQYYWFPSYVGSLLSGDNNMYTTEQTKHVMFVIADHHEHSMNPVDAKKSAKAWTASYRNTVADLRDHYDNPLRYSWFYPIDHNVDAVVQILNELVIDGLGEIEFHWHHNHDDVAQYERDFAAGVNWLNSYGAALSSGETTKTQFGFIHGNWSLDNSGSTPERNLCGINNEIDYLLNAGSYADYTFSTTRTDAQPRRFSSLYYAVDTPQPKSHDNGQDSSVQVAPPERGYLIFQGPSAFDLRDRTFEHGEIEAWTGFGNHRPRLWVQNAPYVDGKPEWRFVKTYTHGVQSRSKILSADFASLIQALKDYCDELGVKLHYVTAREAYNILKAAEQGMVGDPELYRDFLIPPPVNSRLIANQPLEFQSVTDRKLVVRAVNDQHASVIFRHPVLDSFSGVFELFTFRNDGTSDTIDFDENATGQLTTSAPVTINRPTKLSRTNDGYYIYALESLQEQASELTAER